MNMILEKAELNFLVGERVIVITSSDKIEIDGEVLFNIDEMESILTEAKAFREYRKSRMPEKKQEESKKCYCGLSLVYTKEMLISSLESKEDDRSDNNINEVIQKNHDVILSTLKKEHDKYKAAHVLQEVSAFTTTTACTYHKCNNSSYWITTDGRIKIKPEAYNIYIYTTVAEIQRLRAMTAAELLVFYKAYEKQTYPNKRYALRAFLRDIADGVFPGVNGIADVEPAVTPDPADEPNGFSVCAEDMLPADEYHEPEIPVYATPTPEEPPIDPYVLKTRMNKRTAELWEKFADPTKVKQ